MKRLLIAPVLFAVLMSHALVQAQAAPQVTGKYTISGVVVSAATGQPLDRADVTLQTPNQGTVVAAITTSEDGRFVFEHLAAAKYSLEASRRGYIAAAYDEHEGFSTAIVTGEGLASDGLTFRLSPRAVIKGTVTDEAGDVVPQARVSLYRQNLRNGLGNIVRAGTTVTDDTGAYEFGRLEAGNYYVAVTATPWYATRPQVSRDAEGNVIAGDQRSALDVAYPTTF
ncbi:MAG TPA: carboxypeptidase-like regulatory domain-containing protein, partial [Silvibacterium sp.]|nr:carboxypeptidase-like regulatory domain-containing protein [Silvibacterium sp.]